MHSFEEIGFGTPLYEQMLALREAHLRRPLGLSLSAADRAGEDSQIHLAAVEEGCVQASLCLKPVSDTRVKLRQMVVSPERRGTGLGSDLVSFGEDLARRRGFTDVELHARVAVRPFYEQLGYRSVGEGFVEIGIPHLEMVKSLRD